MVRGPVESRRIAGRTDDLPALLRDGTLPAILRDKLSN